MIIGVLKEIKENEYRVSATPATVQEIVAHGHSVLVEKSAGDGSGFSDAEYAAAGAEIVETADEVFKRSDLFYKVKELFPQEFPYLNSDKIVFTYLHSNAHPEETDALLNSHVTAFAYEDVTSDEPGQFPLLAPMSVLAGKGGFLAALHHMQAVNGGKGMLLAKLCGVETPVMTILGCGHSGKAIAELAAGFGCEVRVLDINMKVMQETQKYMPANVSFLISNRSNLEKCLKESDVVFNCILWPKHRKDHIIYREDLKMMKPGSMIVDVACDDGGAVETCLSTTHANPVFKAEGITHYCVDNIPSAFSRSASILLANATLPYLLQIADKGPVQAIKDNKHLRAGLTCYDGYLTLEETALKQNRVHTPADKLLETL
ncbi:MAG: alanine dehydrogenase [Ruminococcaceae bacterium]|nr:alanine dehydrogenase [Oscillospiraceae bacterium]